MSAPAPAQAAANPAGMGASVSRGSASWTAMSSARRAGEGLSERQIAWLEKQLDGRWRTVESKSVPDATVTADQEPKDEAELLDAMIERRLATQGKTLIDAKRIDRLRQAMSDLNDALGGLGA